MIIGLAGKKQVGKSTAAGCLVEAGFERASFAGPMKEIVEHLLLCVGLSSHDVRYFERNKEEVMPIVGVTMRHLLQSLGTDWGRKLIHPDLWVLAAAQRIDAMLAEGCSLVFEDVRFDNEAAFIRELGGRILHIERDTGLTDEHASELGVKFVPGDVLINNCNMPNGLGLYRLTVLTLAGVDAE